MARRHSGLANREETRRNGSCVVCDESIVGYIKDGPDNGMHYFIVAKRQRQREKERAFFLRFHSFSPTIKFKCVYDAYAYACVAIA